MCGWSTGGERLGWTFPLLNTAPWAESHACILHFVAFTEIVLFYYRSSQGCTKKNLSAGTFVYHFASCYS